MPATPELLRILRLIRAVEVHRQVETHQHRYTNRDIGITREVRIDLQTVCKERKQVLKTGEQERIIKDAVDEVYREIIGHDDFLRQAIQNPEDSNTKGTSTETEGFVQLRNKFLGTHDRSGYKLREEGYIESEVENVLDRFYTLMIDIGGVGNDLEDIKRDTYRQDNCIHGESARLRKTVADVREDIKHPEVRTEDIVHSVRNEIRVFEICEQTQVYCHGKSQ